LKFDRFREFWNPFCGRIRMKYRMKAIIVTCKIAFILYDLTGFRSWAYYPLYLEMLFM